MTRIHLVDSGVNGGNFDICLADERIGTIMMNDNKIMGVRIDERYRGQGYGHAAIEQLLDELRHEFEYVHTSAVASDALKTILRDNGFEPKPDVYIEWEKEFKPT